MWCPVSAVTDSLFDPRNGDLSLQVADADERAPAAAQRTNCFAVYWLRDGSGTFWAGTARHSFTAPCLLFAVPYQPVRVESTAVRGVVLRFHANFLCVETVHAEVGCNGVLFNDPYGAPVVALDADADHAVDGLVGPIRRELAEGGLAHAEALVAYLKLLLIRATRLKREQQATPADSAPRRPPLLDDLRASIEANYRRRHAPADYADLLGVTPKTLGRLVKAHHGRTLTDLIRDRVLLHAKWELLHTLRPVKEIAREVGFDDELYFSRLFRKATGLSPTAFREFETAIRGGSNLSMP